VQGADTIETGHRIIDITNCPHVLWRGYIFMHPVGLTQLCPMKLIQLTLIAFFRVLPTHLSIFHPDLL
jgi:hypothetical protein